MSPASELWTEMADSIVTPTPWQDERLHRRHQNRLECELLVDDVPWHCRVRDISLGGAGVEPPIPAALGRQVVLSCPALGFDLPGRVVNVAYRRTCLVFELDPVLREKLRAFLDSSA